MEWDWGFAWRIVPALAEGLIVTVEVTLLASALALALGLMVAIARASPAELVRKPTIGVTEFIRRTPLLVQLYFLFYVLPDVGVLLPAFGAGVVGLGIHYATYVSEVYRGGISSVPKGQWEAAKACNLTVRQTWTTIILPQAIPPM